jgi:hypothetical protein
MQQLMTTKGPSWEQIVWTAKARVEAWGPTMQLMRDVRDRYNGDIVYPWANQLAGPDAAIPNMTPQLMAEAIDNYAMRASEVMPMIFSAAIDRTAPRSTQRANTRKRALEALLLESKFPMLSRKYMRHLAGYASMSLLVEPDFKKGIPRLRVVNPMNVFPDVKEAENYDDTTNCIYIHGHSWTQIKAMFGDRVQECNRLDRGELHDVIRYVDEEVQVMGYLGKRHEWSYDIDFDRAREMVRIEHRSGRFPGGTANRVALDSMSNNLASQVGQLDVAAKLQLLDLIATEKAIFPDVYVLGDGQRAPVLTTSDGKWKDGRTGETNTIKDATSIGTIRTTPDPAGARMIERFERNFRVSTGLAGQFGGETSNALRTGRAIDTMLGASVDPRVREMQETVQWMLPAPFEALLTSAIGYWPEKKFLLISNWGTAEQVVEFEPKKDFEEFTKVGVKYAAAGTDSQGLTIVLGQQLGMGAISLETFRLRHPDIDDADFENRKVAEEQLEKAAMESIVQGAMQMQIPLDEVALIQNEFHKPGTDIFDAVQNAQKRIKALQEKAAEEAAAEAELAAQQQPDPAMMQQPQAMPDQIGPTNDQEGMRQLMNAMRSSNQGV